MSFKSWKSKPLSVKKIISIINSLYTNDTLKLDVFPTAVILVTHKLSRMFNYQQGLRRGNYSVINVAQF